MSLLSAISILKDTFECDQRPILQFLQFETAQTKKTQTHTRWMLAQEGKVEGETQLFLPPNPTHISTLSFSWKTSSQQLLSQ